jgi:hypothetical protein
MVTADNRGGVSDECSRQHDVVVCVATRVRFEWDRRDEREGFLEQPNGRSNTSADIGFRHVSVRPRSPSAAETRKLLQHRYLVALKAPRATRNRPCTWDLKT